MEKLFFGKGKTTKLVEMSSKNNIPIVVYDRNSCDFIKRKYQNTYQYSNMPNPIVLNELEHIRRSSIHEVYIDNADFVFKHIFEEKYGVKLAGYSMILESDECWSDTPEDDLSKTLNRLIPMYEKAINNKDFNVSYQILKNIDMVKTLLKN